MTEISKSSKRLHILALTLVELLPVLVFLGGILLLVRGFIVTVSFAVTFLIVPCAVFVCNYLILRSKLEKVLKAVFCILLLVVFVLETFVMMGMGYYLRKITVSGEKAVAKYEKISETVSTFPSIDELGDMEMFEYDNFFIHALIFDTETDYFICKYSEEEYAKQKTKVEETYVFQEEPLYADGYFCEPAITIEGYDFKMLSFEGKENSLYFPKDMILIASNDETREIVYMHFVDTDLDYIESLEEFMMNECGWNYIR